MCLECYVITQAESCVGESQTNVLRKNNWHKRRRYRAFVVAEHSALNGCVVKLIRNLRFIKKEEFNVTANCRLRAQHS